MQTNTDKFVLSVYRVAYLVRIVQHEGGPCDKCRFSIVADANFD